MDRVTVRACFALLFALPELPSTPVNHQLSRRADEARNPPVYGRRWTLVHDVLAAGSNNMFTVLVDPGRLAGVDWLRREIDGFIDYVKASPPADPKLPVLVPGEPERLAQAERGRAGVEVDATTWGEIVDAAETVGLTRAEVATLSA